MADFPTSIKAWTDLVDGVSPANSSDVNSIYDEVTAMQTAQLTDSTSLDSSTGLHGYLPKLSGDSDTYINGIGEWATVISGGGGASSDLIEHGHTGTTDGGLIRLDTISAPTDSTSLDASTDFHGLLPKLNGTSDNYFNGKGEWASIVVAPSTDLVEHNHSTSDTGGLIRLDTITAPTDSTSLDASSDLHGLLPKLSGTSDEYLNGKGEWWNVPLATSDVAGKIYLADTSDINEGSSDVIRAITSDKFVESNYGIRFVYAPLNGSTALAAGDKAYFPIPVELSGWNLVQARATCGSNSSSDLTRFTVKKGGGTQSMLSTNITIDPTLLDSLSSSDQPVISSSDNPVTSTDIIEVSATSDCGTGMTYAGVLTGWKLP